MERAIKCRVEAGKTWDSGQAFPVAAFPSDLITVLSYWFIISDVA